MAQENDICANAIDISVLAGSMNGLVANYCSPAGALGNEDATLTPDVPCFNASLRDVWFRFRPSKNTASITIIGDRDEDGGGTLKRPDIGVFAGECGQLISIACQSTLDNFGLVRLSDLAPGEQYFIRVGSLPENRGTFQLCINDFLIDVAPNRGCFNAKRLCNKNDLDFEVLESSAEVENRDLRSCVSGFEEDKKAQWLSFTAANNGDLTFVINPKNDRSDLKFALFRLPQNPENCLEDAELIRCLGSGPTTLDPDGCLGPIGLQDGSIDEDEPLGCSAAYDNFLAPLVATQGQQFLLVISNESSDEGFELSFSGSLEFEAPDFNIVADQNGFCNGDDVIIGFENDAFLDDNSIDQWSWSFGASARPDSSTTQGPHTIYWTEPGDKLITSEFVTSDGCEMRAELMLNVILCCDPRNPMVATSLVSNATCSDVADGTIELSVSGGNGPYDILWDDNILETQRESLGQGVYSVTISDQQLCDTILDIEIQAPEALAFIDEKTLPECGEPNGSISLTISGGTGDYDILWEPDGSFELDTVRDSLHPAIYPITIRDDNGCLLTDEIDLTTIAIMRVDSLNSILKGPSCTGFRDGQFDLVMRGGRPPYSFDYNNGDGPGQSQFFSGFGDTTFQVVIRDSDGCFQIQDFQFPDPPLLVMDSVLDEGIKCPNDLVGEVGVFVSGGTTPYKYLFNGRQFSVDSTQIVSNLPPDFYDVVIRDANGCELSYLADLTVPENHSPLNASTFELVRGDVLNINIPIDQGEQIEWLTPDGLSCIDCGNPEINIEESKTYFYRITSVDGCVSEFSLFVDVRPILPVYIPSAFSPNFDGVNDELNIYVDDSVIEIKIFNIYDRWGNLIFSKSNPTPGAEGWDGRYKGEVLRAGSFVYFTEVVFLNGNTKTITGQFNLIN